MGQCEITSLVLGVFVEFMQALILTGQTHKLD